MSAITPFDFFGFCDEDFDDGECELEDDAKFGVPFDNHLFFAADGGFAGIFGPSDIAYSIQYNLIPTAPEFDSRKGLHARFCVIQGCWQQGSVFNANDSFAKRL